MAGRCGLSPTLEASRTATWVPLLPPTCPDSVSLAPVGTSLAPYQMSVPLDAREAGKAGVSGISSLCNGMGSPPFSKLHEAGKGYTRMAKKNDIHQRSRITRRLYICMSARVCTCVCIHTYKYIYVCIDMYIYPSLGLWSPCFGLISPVRGFPGRDVTRLVASRM